MQNKEVAVMPDNAVGDALPASSIRAQVDLIQHVMKEVMIKDTHYGVIPGTPKPSLFKPGAEKLCLTFRLDPQYTSTERFVGEHLFINSTCTLFHQTTGRRLGSGQGSCSTKESKYAYRKGQRQCPKCGAESIIKGKSEYGGGWLCYQKRGGCGAKWKDGAVEIESQNTDRIPNEDLADQYNTVLKMANKRSLVAAVLNVTAASDLFTQDIEDMPIPPDVKEQPPLPKGAEMLARLETVQGDGLATHRPDDVVSGSAADRQQSQDAPAPKSVGGMLDDVFAAASAVADYEAVIADGTSTENLQKTWDEIVKDKRIVTGDRTKLYQQYQRKAKELKGKS